MFLCISASPDRPIQVSRPKRLSLSTAGHPFTTMENQTDWIPVIEAFGAVKTEGRDNADIMMDYESLRRQLKQNLPVHSAQGVDHLFWRFSGPYKSKPNPPPKEDGEYTRICDIGTRI